MASENLQKYVDLSLFDEAARKAGERFAEAAKNDDLDANIKLSDALAKEYSLGDALFCQRERFAFVRAVLGLLNIDGWGRGVSGFDFALHRNGSKILFMLVDSFADLDDELTAMIWAKGANAIKNGGASSCAVIEVSAETSIDSGWEGGEAGVDENLKWLSLDVFFSTYLGEDLSNPISSRIKQLGL